MGSGANVVLTTGGIDDLCLKYFVEAGAMAVRRCNKADLKRISRATGGKCVMKIVMILASHCFKAVCHFITLASDYEENSESKIAALKYGFLWILLSLLLIFQPRFACTRFP